MNGKLTRRQALQTTVAAAGALTILPSGCVHSTAANGGLNVGVVGAGMGSGNAKALAEQGEHVVALCDVDRGRLNRWGRAHPRARRYTDFRKMLEVEKLDGIVVATPDHTHAVISVTAMAMGVHCFCQKPLTHDLYEARKLAQVAARTRSITQIGTNTCTGLAHTPMKALMESGTLGEISEVHVWTDRPIWAQGFERPGGGDDVPSDLDWDLWLGPAPERPFRAKWPEGHPAYALPKDRRRSQVYHPFVWRGWWDFGTGALGDIASHSLNQVYWNLSLGPATSAEVVECSGMTEEMFPQSSVLRITFPSRLQERPVTVVWYDGGRRPPEAIGGKTGAGGVVYLGTRNSYPKGRGPFRGEAYDYAMPEGEFSRRDEIHKDWCDGIRTGRQPAGHFGYSGPLTESILLANIALKVGRRVEWDTEAMRVTNCDEANRYVRREYRKGWSL